MVCCRALLLCVLPVVVAGMGCTSGYMVNLEHPEPLQPVADATTLVFIRASSIPLARHFLVVEVQGKRFIGIAEPSSHFRVILPPGPRTFVLDADEMGVDAVHGDFAPGRIYFIKIDSSPLSAGMHAIKPGTEDWNKLGSWLNETTAQVPDTSRGQHLINIDFAALEMLLADGLTQWHGYDDEDKEQHTLMPWEGATR